MLGGLGFAPGISFDKAINISILSEEEEMVHATASMSEIRGPSLSAHSPLLISWRLCTCSLSAHASKWDRQMATLLSSAPVLAQVSWEEDLS